MASIRDILKKLIEKAGPPQTGAGVYGRAGGVAPGAPTKPIPGLQTNLAGPVAQRNYGPEVSELPTPTPVQPVPATAATPPPAALTQALRAPAPLPQGQPVGADVETVPFQPPPLDPGTPLAPPPPQIHEAGQQLAPLDYLGDGEGGEQAGGEKGALDLGSIPITIGDDEGENDAEIERLATELAKRMLEARGK